MIPDNETRIQALYPGTDIQRTLRCPLHPGRVDLSPDGDELPQEEQTGYRYCNFGTGIGIDLIKNIGFLMCVLLVPTNPALLAQDNEPDHDHSFHRHAHPKNEIGVGNSLSYLVGERELAYALHVHYLRSIEQSRFSAGIGYEQIFDEHRHRSLALIGAFNPASSLILSLAPGILFGTREEPGIKFAMHTEVVYEFEIGHFHLGPSLEFATTFKEYHLGVGVHIAFTFP